MLADPLERDRLAKAVELNASFSLAAASAGEAVASATGRASSAQRLLRIPSPL